MNPGNLASEGYGLTVGLRTNVVTNGYGDGLVLQLFVATTKGFVALSGSVVSGLQMSDMTGA